MSKPTSLTPILLKVILLFKKKKNLAPADINNHIGDGNYASKHVLYLKMRDYVFDTVRDGRNIKYYSLVKEPDNSEQLISEAQNKKKNTATKKYRKALINVIEKKKEPTVDEIKAKVKVPKKVENKNKKSVAEIKAANLAKLKSASVSTSSESDRLVSGSSFDIDSDWDEFTISRDELKYIL